VLPATLAIAARFEHGLDIHHRSSVDRLEVLHADAEILDRQHCHDV
jgi:hypothetical protein